MLELICELSVEDFSQFIEISIDTEYRNADNQSINKPTLMENEMSQAERQAIAEAGQRGDAAFAQQVSK